MSCGPAFFEAVCQVPGNDTLDYNLAVTDLRQTCDGYDAMDGSRHILVVDDDKELRGLLSRFLTGNGFRVSVAQDAAAMTQTMSAARIDLIILDIMMPGEDGLSICRRLRANGTIPIIMLTAKGSEFDRVARPRNRRRRLPFQTIWHPRAARPRSCRPAARGDARTRIATRAHVGSSSLRAGAWTCRDGSCVRRRTRWSISVPRSSTCSSRSSNIRNEC